MPTLTFGELIRTQRVVLGLSGRGLAKAVGISAAYLFDIEHGKRVPTGDRLRRLAEQLQLNPEQLLTLSTRLGEPVRLYIAEHPLAAELFRQIAHRRVDDDGLRGLLQLVQAYVGAPQ